MWPNESGPRGLKWTARIAEKGKQADAVLDRMLAERLLDRLPMILTRLDMGELIDEKPIAIVSGELIAATSRFGLVAIDDEIYVVFCRAMPDRFLKAINVNPPVQNSTANPGKIIVRGYDRSEFFAPFRALEVE